MMNVKTVSVVLSKRLSVIPSVRLSVCLSVHVEQLGSHWTDFHEIRHLKISRKTVYKIKVLSKSDKNNGYYTWRLMYIYGNI
jgi:hypothetical protein